MLYWNSPFPFCPGEAVCIPDSCLSFSSFCFAACMSAIRLNSSSFFSAIASNYSGVRKLSLRPLNFSMLGAPLWPLNAYSISIKEKFYASSPYIISGSVNLIALEKFERLVDYSFFHCLNISCVLSSACLRSLKGIVSSSFKISPALWPKCLIRIGELLVVLLMLEALLRATLRPPA